MIAVVLGTWESHILVWTLILIVATTLTVLLEAGARRKPRAPRGGHLWERQHRG